MDIQLHVQLSRFTATRLSAIIVKIEKLLVFKIVVYIFLYIHIFFFAKKPDRKIFRTQPKFTL